MELIPTLISLSGFGIAITYVTIVHKIISSGEAPLQQPPQVAAGQKQDVGRTAFIRKHAGAH